MNRVPVILTDDWAVWVVEQLESNGETALSDADIAAIINNVDSATRAKLNQLIASGANSAIDIARAYTNDAVTNALAGINAAISNGDIRSTNTANTYTDTKARDTLAAANQYTDQHAGTGGVSKTYVDNGDSNTLSKARTLADTAEANANNYADNAATSALSSAGEYTDEQVSQRVLRSELTDIQLNLLNSAEQEAASRDVEVLTQAKAYADSLESGGDPEGVQELIDQSATETRGYADAGDANTLESAQAYADSAVNGSADGFAEIVDGKVSVAVDLLRGEDADNLAAAKAYTDDAIANGGGAGEGEVTKAYVDNGDVNALNTAKLYADGKASAAETNAKTYTDNKQVKPSAGWAQTDFTADVQSKLNATTRLGSSVVVPTFTAGYETASTARVQKVDGVIYAMREINANSGNLATANNVMKFPVGMRPAFTEGFVCRGTGTSLFGVIVNTDGSVDITVISGTSTFMRLGGIRFVSSDT